MRPKRLVYRGVALLALAVAIGAGCNLVTGADELAVSGSGAQNGQPAAGGQSTTEGGHTPQGGAGGVAPAPDPCEDVSCGPAGFCATVGEASLCVCGPGYHSESQGCVANPEPGPCDDVVCGAHATCAEGDCICDDGYEGDPVAGCTLVSDEEQLVRAELVAIAEAELGNCEGQVERPYMLGQPGLWCYDFVAWVYAQSSYPVGSPLSLPTYDADDMPVWWLPEAGDLIKFDIQHYGMVKGVSPDGSIIYTVEGNVSSCVVNRSVSISTIDYFGSLDSKF